MTWRYQVVMRGDGDDVAYSLCEVYFDHGGRLWHWTEEAAIAPMGDSLEDLEKTLRHMLSDARRSKPVRFDELKAGMVFEATEVGRK